MCKVEEMFDKIIIIADMFINTIVRTYVIQLLGTYVTILCNCLIL